MTGVSLRLAGSAFIDAMKAVYQYIGIVMAYSALWVFVGLLPLLAATTFGEGLPAGVVVLLLLLTVFTAGPAAAAVFANIARIIGDDEVTVRDFFRELKSLYGKSVLLTLANVFVFLVLIADLMFAIRNPSRWIQLLSGLWFYFLVFWLLMNVWMLPLLVNQRTGPITVIKRAALLTVDNLVVTIITGLFTLLLLAISIVLAAPLLILFMGSVAFLQNYAFAKVMKKYEDDDEPEEPTMSQEED